MSSKESGRLLGKASRRVFDRASGRSASGKVSSGHAEVGVARASGRVSGRASTEGIAYFAFVSD